LILGLFYGGLSLFPHTSRFGSEFGGHADPFFFHPLYFSCLPLDFKARTLPDFSGSFFFLVSCLVLPSFGRGPSYPSPPMISLAPEVPFRLSARPEGRFFLVLLISGFFYVVESRVSCALHFSQCARLFCFSSVPLFSSFVRAQPDCDSCLLLGVVS